ncbi:MAG: hypothetical protein NTY09_12125, partial [bacterium]|nr:hypothetical protein [bacterium]
GIVYFPQVDDVKRLIDEQSMAYAAMKLAQATEDARWVLDAYFAEHPDQRNFNFEIMTPFGRIEISGSGNDVHDDGDYFILVDLGGDDLYQGSVGATSRPDIGISTALDLEGNDRYECDQNIPTQGAGVLGCGILYDAKGDDVYIAKDMAQGAGFFGTGIIYDGDGADEYQMEETGQGSGNFGHGLALDSGDGNDSYRMWGEGQGFGGCNGIGILANWSGDEHYYAEPYASVVNRGDYHSAFALNVSNCQGVGSGRRGDGTDGHSYAGGLGLIADYHGNDKYEAGNFSIGCGYWFGIGLVYDKEGDDTYYSPVYTQASAVHYAIGAIIDEAGNDVHDTWDNSTSALSFARDFAISMLVDKAGDDYYRAYNTSLCYVNIRSNAFFFELGGNDHYVVGSPQQMLGACDFSDYSTPSAINPFAQYCNSFSLFMDTGGDDIYESWTREEVPSTETADQSTGTIPQPPQFIDHYVPSEIYGNNMRWEFPIPGTETYGYNNFGIGWDLEAGGASNPEFNGSVIDMTWLDPRPEPEAGEGE